MEDSNDIWTDKELQQMIERFIVIGQRITAIRRNYASMGIEVTAKQVLPLVMPYSSNQQLPKQ